MFSKKNTNIDTKEKVKGFNPLKHIGMMGACCLLPLLIVGILPLLNLSARGNVFLGGLSSLICPIMMGVMMFSMFRGSKKQNCCKEDRKEDENTR